MAVSREVNITQSSEEQVNILGVVTHLKHITPRCASSLLNPNPT